MSNLLKKKLQAEDDRLDLIFHALSDRTRRALLLQLSKGPLKVMELAEAYNTSFQSVSKHIKVLESAGLVEKRIEGRVHNCSLEAAPLAEIEDWLSFYRSFWEGQLDKLAEFLEEK
jgi:DNA-binding transcriptional ArsR family regulator